MKNLFIHFAALALVLILKSCDKDCNDGSGFRGEWEWIESTAVLVVGQSHQRQSWRRKP